MNVLRRSNTSSSNRCSSSSPALSWIHLRSLLLIASSPIPNRGSLKSPWSQRERKRALSRDYWNSLFTADGRLRDGGSKFLKKVRNRGIDPSIRSEVWPFLLGLYHLNSSEVQRKAVKARKRKEYEKLRIRCRAISKSCDDLEDPYSPPSSCIFFKRPDESQEEEEEDEEDLFAETESWDADCFLKRFKAWQRIIRLDAVRTDSARSQAGAGTSAEAAEIGARAVGLKDYEHLEPSTVEHACRLVAVLEAYAMYDPEIGYCQGMSDLLSPVLVVMEEEEEAFWCFVGFMKKARHNFRLDEAGIRRQLSVVSRIIRWKDAQLYRHLEKLEAEDCCFVYRMVVVLFRRELTFEQTACLWEVMWANQAALRAGMGGTACGRMSLLPPPTDDLLLYAIAACVLQRRKLIIESYISVDEIIRDCNSMAGQLDVWRLLHDAHYLVLTLHYKIRNPLFNS